MMGIDVFRSGDPSVEALFLDIDPPEGLVNPDRAFPEGTGAGDDGFGSVIFHGYICLN
jgi:hypothetical protein